MRKRSVKKIFVYFLCLSFLSLMSGFPALAAETRTLPIGEMVSKGEVKLNGSATPQEKIASSYSPVFPGTKITTDKGAATVRLGNNNQIGIYSNSSFTFDEMDQYSLSQGTIEFYAPPTSELKIKAGDVSIVKQRGQGSGREADTFASVSIQPGGSITVKSTQGKVSVLNPNNAVLADLGPKETVTISQTSDGKVRVAAAAAGGTAAGGGTAASESSGFLGLSTWGWVGAAAAAAAVGVGAGVAAGGGGSGSSCD